MPVDFRCGEIAGKLILLVNSDPPSCRQPRHKSSAANGRLGSRVIRLVRQCGMLECTKMRQIRVLRITQIIPLGGISRHRAAAPHNPR